MLPASDVLQRLANLPQLRRDTDRLQLFVRNAKAWDDLATAITGELCSTVAQCYPVISVPAWRAPGRS